MPTIVEFLTVRLDNDEAIARAAQGAPIQTNGRGYAHADRWSPSRVLADVAAKRAIVQECDKYITAYQEATGPHPGHGGPLGWRMLKTLAAVYSDHQDYLPEWRP